MNGHVKFEFVRIENQSDGSDSKKWCKRKPENEGGTLENKAAGLPYKLTIPPQKKSLFKTVQKRLHNLRPKIPCVAVYLASLMACFIEPLAKVTYSVIAAKPESKIARKSWIPGRASLARNDDFLKLEYMTLPMFYERPNEFAKIMRSAIAPNASFFNTQAMVAQYVQNTYSALERTLPQLGGTR